MKIEVSRPSVPLLKAEIHQTRGKMTANTLFRSKTALGRPEASERDTSFFLYTRSVPLKCPAVIPLPSGLLDDDKAVRG